METQAEILVDADSIGDLAVLPFAEAFEDDYLLWSPETTVTLAILDHSLGDNIADTVKRDKFFDACGVQVNTGSSVGFRIRGFSFVRSYRSLISGARAGYERERGD